MWHLEEGPVTMADAHTTPNPAKRPPSEEEDHNNITKRRKKTEQRVCAQCQIPKSSSAFSARQRKKGEAARCRCCIDEEAKPVQKKHKGLHKCASCHFLKHTIKSFSLEQLTKGVLAKCHPCVVQAKKESIKKYLKSCSLCFKYKTVAEFPKKLKGDDAGYCNECWHNQQLPWEDCDRCGEQFSIYYLFAHDKRELKKKYGTMALKHCDVCQVALDKKKQEERRLVLEKAQRDKQPRCCSHCHELKYKESFADAQWESRWNKHGKSSCLVCLPTPESEAEQARKDAWAKTKKTFIALGKKGAIFYDYPLRTIHDRSFGDEEPAKLEGEYDIVFSFAHGHESRESRTRRGTFTLAKSSDDTGKTSFEGRLEFDRTIPLSHAVTFDCNCTMTQSGMESISPPGVWSLFFDELPLESFADGQDRRLIRQFEDRNADLHVIKRRVAMPWKPQEYGEDNIITVIDNVQFDTLEEADALTRQYNDKILEFKDSWIPKHLGLSHDIAKHIHQFAAPWRPPPVLYLHPGDLVLTIWWHFPHHPCEGSGVMSELVLRRKNNQS